MQELLPGIWKVYRDPASGGWGYSYLLRRDGGNVFLPRLARTASIRNEFEAIEQAGGIRKIYITDRHFAGAFCGTLSQHFNAPILYSQAEHKAIAKQNFANAHTFPYQQQQLETDWEVVPTPGHTSGGVCYLWSSPLGRCLFTGDLLYNAGQTWVVGSKKWQDVQASLEHLMTLDFDYLIGCGDDELGTSYLVLPPQERAVFLNSLKAACAAS